MKTCTQCSASFAITDQDQQFYKKLNVPEPTLCPQCRRQRRLAWRNERNLYRRKCDATEKEVISVYSPDKPFTVYDYKYWLSDKWDPLNYGRDFDFNRPFFKQFAALQEDAPKKNLFIEQGMENCDYCNYGAKAKDCYMVFSVYESESCMYSDTPGWCTEDVDGYFNLMCQHCYECVYCEHCFEVLYSEYSHHCSNSYFLSNCSNCEYCFGCVNLHHKKYCFLNEQLTKEQYEEKIAAVLNSASKIFDFSKQFHTFALQHPRKALRVTDSENCSGDLLRNSKNCFDCYDTIGLLDSKFCDLAGVKSSDLYDCMLTGEGVQLCYENIGSVGGHHALFQLYARRNTNVYYCVSCRDCQHCFGCEGLARKQYCILNKQYTKEEYEELLPQIIEHMKETKEWGEFFPISLSPFSYNETMAYDHFPLSKEEVLRRGWQWKEKEVASFSSVTKKIAAERLPETIEAVDDDVLNWAIECAESKKLFKIIKSELQFYRKMNIPLPRYHPDVRYQKRFAKKNPYKLWDRQCAECQKEIQTTYAPDRPEKIFCEKCYLDDVY